jgi:hypothetical protein
MKHFGLDLLVGSWIDCSERRTSSIIQSWPKIELYDLTLRLLVLAEAKAPIAKISIELGSGTTALLSRAAR